MPTANTLARRMAKLEARQPERPLLVISEELERRGVYVCKMPRPPAGIETGSEWARPFDALLERYTLVVMEWGREDLDW